MMRRVTDWIYRRRAQAIAAAQLAEDFRMPLDKVSGILERASADARKLSPDGDAGPIIRRAAAEMKQLDTPWSFSKDEVQRYLQRLPARDSAIFAQWQKQKKHKEIAETLGVDVETVRKSLAQTYVNLRLTTMPVAEPEAQRRKQA